MRGEVRRGEVVEVHAGCSSEDEPPLDGSRDEVVRLLLPCDAGTPQIVETLSARIEDRRPDFHREKEAHFGVDGIQPDTPIESMSLLRHEHLCDMTAGDGLSQCVDEEGTHAR